MAQRQPYQSKAWSVYQEKDENDWKVILRESDFYRKNKKEQKKYEERKKIEAEISFKKWKLKKNREQKHEKKVQKYRELQEQEQLMMLKEKKRMLNQGADVMLAYSLNKNIRDIEGLRKRPKSARMGLRI